MSSAKIENAFVETAISAAADSLANDPDIAWVRKSSLVQRAYFLGLIKGLDAIAEDDAIGKKWPVEIFMSTLWRTSADDTFPSTQLGQDFTALEKGLREIRTKGNWDRSAIDKVFADIRYLDQRWRSCVESALTLLGKIESAPAGFKLPIGEGPGGREGESEELIRIQDCMYGLDKMMRFMSLLETHHELDKRF
jgi:hypothetical protein